jgi:hypothetical protein
MISTSFLNAPLALITILPSVIVQLFSHGPLNPHSLPAKPTQTLYTSIRPHSHWVSLQGLHSHPSRKAVPVFTLVRTSSCLVVSLDASIWFITCSINHATYILQSSLKPAVTLHPHTLSSLTKLSEYGHWINPWIWEWQEKRELHISRNQPSVSSTSSLSFDWFTQELKAPPT